MKKIIHTADWHLGCRLYLEDRLEEHGKFLGWLEGVLARERPDLLVIAGDVFDTYAPSNSAQSLYYDFLAHVFKGGLARHVVVTSGNHDSPSVLASPSRALDCLDVTVVPGEESGQAFAFDCADGGRLAVAAIPFLKESFLRNRADAALPPGEKQSDGFRRHVAEVSGQARALAPGAPLVVIAHCTVSGASACADFREGGMVGGVDAVEPGVFPRAAYVALGHIHVPQAIGGRDAVRYSGSALPMNFGEAGYAKSIAVAEIPDRGGTFVRTIPVPVFQEMETIEGTCDEILARLRRLSAEDPGASRWLEIFLAAGEGGLPELRAKARDEIAGTGMRVLNLRDKRPRAGVADPAEAARIDLRVTDPLDLARERLLEERLSGPEVEEYMAMIGRAVSEARLEPAGDDVEAAR